MKRLVPLVVTFLLCCAANSRAENITIATWNIENWNGHFEAHRATTRPVAKDPQVRELITDLRKANDEDNWEIAQVILDPDFSPDILVVEEAADQSDLSYFNRRWLDGAYETAVQFPTNTDRHQNLDLLMKPGFKILDRRDRYYLEPDPVGNERGARLFARGPAFVKVRSPGGYVFWVGVTHMKSKNVGVGFDTDRSRGNDKPDVTQKKLDAARWRHREAERTHAILNDLEKAGPDDVILLGDMNDTLGEDAYEKDAGGDALAALVGPVQDGFILATKPLADAGKYSFNGYYRNEHHELIDHVIVSKSMRPAVKEVQVFQDAWTPVASDHFPVMVKVQH